MFFFIGMHTSEKDYGIEGYHTCTRCGHVGDWHLIKATTWLILLIVSAASLGALRIRRSRA